MQEQKTYTLTLSPTDMLEIEERARQMRAEAIRYGAAQTRAWIKARLSGLFGGAGQAA